MGFRESRSRNSFAPSQRKPRFTSPVQRQKAVEEFQETAFLEPKKDEEHMLGWEKDWQEFSNKVNAISTQTELSDDPLGAAVSWGPKEIGSFLSWTVPFGKYIVPFEAMKLADMSDEERNSALAWEGVGFGLLAGAQVITKAGKPAVKKLAKWASDRKKLKMVPIEDAVSTIAKEGGVWTPFDEVAEGVRVLKGKASGMGFAGDEAEVIAKVAKGDAGENALKAIAWEKGDKLSSAWKKKIGRIGEKVKTRRESVPDPGGAPITEIDRRQGVKLSFAGKGRRSGTDRRVRNYVNPDETFLRRTLVLDEEMKEALKATNLRSNYVRRLYQKNIDLMGKGVVKDFTDNVLKAHVEKLYGKKAEAFKLGTVSEEELANYLSSIFTPQGGKFLTRAHRLGQDAATFTYFTPERHVYGFGEALYQTKSRLFDPLVRSLENANGYAVKSMNTLMGMLEQRGFGKAAEKATGTVFKPNKVLWNEKNLKATRDLLQKMDNIASMGQMGKKLNKGEAREMINLMMNETKENSPIVFELMSVARDYSDLLYKEMVQLYPSKIIEKLPWSKAGGAKVNQLGKLWSVRAEKIFSTGSNLDAPKKIQSVKKMLKEFRELLKDPKNFDGGLTEEMQKEVLGRLAYGSKVPGAFPAYLEAYLPRVQQRGTSFMASAKRALGIEGGFMKGRTREISGKLDDFQTIFEARTRSQGKQLFFYDEANDLVKYAQKLPDAWKKHFDFTLSRAMSQPSKWDHTMAEVLKRMPGFGNVDEFQVMRIARNITGMQYSGLLGLRPFTVFRNLTQPIIMTPAEMGGGVRDSASLVRGLFRGMMPEHRKYIKSIGAITDFIPEQQIKPMLPRGGTFSKSYDTVQDTFLYGFRMSDRWNRYWSGAAAVEKWNWAVKATPGGPRNLTTFARKLGLRHRADWSKGEIENLVKLGRVEEAKAYFVKDIIADTQYLYKTIEAPSAMGSGGVERMVTSFHSWWMNYGSALRRWFLTGEGTDRIKKLGTAMFTAAAAEQALEWYAGRERAITSLGLGPFPLQGMSIPPAIAPFVNLMQAGKAAFQGYAWDHQESREEMVRKFNESIKSATNLVPGGLAAKQAKEGWDKRRGIGALRSWAQKTEERYDPLLGIPRKVDRSF